MAYRSENYFSTQTECVKTKGNYCCLFPFKAAYSGWFNKCITSQNSKDFQGPWCAVTVRSDGSFYWREGCAGIELIFPGTLLSPLISNMVLLTYKS